MTRRDSTRSIVRSADGTELVHERRGQGPAVIMIDPAGGYSGFDNIRGLAELLAVNFTVHTYDRRGRGESGDTPPWSVQREIEDFAAVLAQAGGTASAYGFSSGGLLALHAASRCPGIEKLALLEPPLDVGRPGAQGELAAHIADLVESSCPEEAVDHFLDSIGVPPDVIAGMESAKPALVAVAGTLVYDCRIGDETTPELLETIHVPSLVLYSDQSGSDLAGAAAVVAAALPHGEVRALPGEWHGPSDEVQAPVLAEWFSELPQQVRQVDDIGSVRR